MNWIFVILVILLLPILGVVVFAAFGGVSQIFEGYDMRNGRYKSGISRIPQRNGSMGDYLKDWIVYLSGWCLGILLIALMLNYDG